jgi:phosphate starvation-inducible PhoH-like protein
MAKYKAGKKVPKYQKEETEYEYSPSDSERNIASEFVKIKKLAFELTKKQKSLITIMHDNKIITVTGPPGTSKTFIACYAAIQALMSGKCKQIVLSKPTEILSGTKDPGALPGSIEEKMSVYAESFFDAFDEILDKKDFKHLWTDKIIEFKPAQYLRGRTIKYSFIIIDEFQNFDIKALKSIVTRLGRNSTIVFMGDTRQNDINKKYVAVDAFNEIIKPIKGCAIFSFERSDIVREKILIDIVDRFEQFEDEGKLPNTIKNN